MHVTDVGYAYIYMYEASRLSISSTIQSLASTVTLGYCFGSSGLFSTPHGLPLTLVEFQ